MENNGTMSSHVRPCPCRTKTFGRHCTALVSICKASPRHGGAWPGWPNTFHVSKLFVSPDFQRLPATSSDFQDDAVPTKSFGQRLRQKLPEAEALGADVLYLGHIPGAPWRCWHIWKHYFLLDFWVTFWLICFDMFRHVVHICPHVVHMLTVSVGGLLFSLSPHMASVVPKFSHSLHYVTVPLRGFRWCGAWWAVATIPYNTKQDWYQWIASSSALCPGRRRNLDFTKLSIFGRGRPRKISHFRYLSYFEDFNVQSKHIEVLFVSLKLWYRFPYVSVKDGCLRTMAPRSKKAEGSGSGIISGSGWRYLDSGHIFAIFHTSHMLVMLVNDSE